MDLLSTTQSEPRELTDHSFRRRALTEAARYGSDSWVFVRELLQNARDAGASRVEFEVSSCGAGGSSAGQLISCRDNGRGMTYEHARRYLFALYASSKETDSAEAGKFGIGFWSVLRFEPRSIIIRSRAAGEDAWQVSLDGGLEHVTAATVDLAVGTEVILERAAFSEDLEQQAFEAAQVYGRFLTLRDAPDRPLSVTVNGRSVNAELSLPAPCATFDGKGFRGAVGLGAEPKVELFAQGLFVRSANSLQELQEVGDLPSQAMTTEDALAELPKLAPRVLIDSAEIDLLLARSDVRHDAHLRRVLRTAERELGRLIKGQLQALRPQPWYRTLLGVLRDRVEPLLGWRLSTAVFVGFLLGLAAFWWLPPRSLSPPGPLSSPGSLSSTADSSAGDSPTVRAGASSEERDAFADQSSAGRSSIEGGLDGPHEGAVFGTGSDEVASALLGRMTSSLGGDHPNAERSTRSAFHPYIDLAKSYAGPRPSSGQNEHSRLTLLYEPATASPFFAALVVDRLDGVRWEASPLPADLPSYRGTQCRKDCLDVRLLVAGGRGVLRLPVPTGHRLDSASARLDGESVLIFETPNGEALVAAPDVDRGVLEYRTGPVVGLGPFMGAVPALDSSARLTRFAQRVRDLPINQRVQQGLDFIADHIRYDQSAAVARAYPPLMDQGKSLVDAALDVGAGDCDVQNGALVVMLRSAGVEARLALGYVGSRGTVAPGLHAWVEFVDEEGRWTVADASLTSDPRLAPAVAEPTVAQAANSDLAGVRTPTGLATSAPSWWSGSSWNPRWAALALLVALVGSTSMVLRRRPTGALELGVGQDLAALLGGALRHPDAFAGLPAMFHGRFVPLINENGAISLHQARRLADDNHLFRSSIGSSLARQAAARGVPVIDAATAEGRVSSLALGAVDLDHWSNLLDRCSSTELCRRVNRSLETLRAPWRIRQGDGLPVPWVEIALDNLGLGQRQVLLDLDHLEFAPVRQLLARQPAAAAFTLLDVLLRGLDLADRERSRVLAAFAVAAVSEASDKTSAGEEQT